MKKLIENDSMKNQTLESSVNSEDSLENSTKQSKHQNDNGNTNRENVPSSNRQKSASSKPVQKR